MKDKKKSLLILGSLILLLGSFHSSSSGVVVESISSVRGNYNKIILITWDGTRPEWLNQYSSSGDLEAIQKMRQEGGEIYLGLGDTPSSTDPCLATIESGFGPATHTVISNQFGNPDGRRVPDGMQTSERLKSFFNDTIKTGHLNSWLYHFHPDREVHGQPDGHIAQSETLDPIFLNAIPGTDVDYWFGSENISFDPADPISHSASLDEYYFLPQPTYRAFSPNTFHSFPLKFLTCLFFCLATDLIADFRSLAIT